MNTRKPSKVDMQIREEACGWFVEARAGDLDVGARREFDAWLRKSPEHLRAYLEFAGIWNEGQNLDPHKQYPVELLIAQASSDHDNVTSLRKTGLRRATSEPLGGRPAPLKTWRPALIGMGLSAVVFLAGVTLWLGTPHPPTYTTAVGEQRSFVLPDGSTILLNSMSTVRVRYTNQQRDVELLRGQALFQVAKDASRPFVVRGASSQIRAVGTEFDVYRKEQGDVVTVLEGRVAVITDRPLLKQAIPAVSGSTNTVQARPLQPPSASDRFYVGAGEQLSIVRETALSAEHVDTAAATAWTQRRLVFESASLDEVAREFNRYNRKQLVLKGPELSTFHISGVFSSSDPVALTRFLQTRLGLQVVDADSEIRIQRNSP